MWTITPQRKAFLDTIAISEGTYHVAQNGYNVLVGSTPEHPLTFDSYADHPRILNKALNSTAAGRYQLLAHWFDAYKRLLNLPDFSPPSQDAIALQQIGERRAMPDVDAGNVQTAITKCANIWASFPGNSYGQHENSMNRLILAFQQVGGNLNT